MKGKIPFTYLNKHLRNVHLNFAVTGKVHKLLKKSLHYVWTERDQIVGCFAKNFKKASHLFALGEGKITPCFWIVYKEFKNSTHYVCTEDG